jgi:hypothetical protein
MVLNQTEHGWLAGCFREQALLLQKQDQKIAAFGSSYMKSWRTHANH